MWILIRMCVVVGLMVPGLGAQELLVANQTTHDVSFIDAAEGRQTGVVDEAAVTGHEIAVSPDGRTAYVPIYGSGALGKPGTDGRTIEVIDVAARKVVRTIDLGKPVRPHCVVYDRGRNLLYVTAELEQAVLIVDPRTDAVVGKIDTGQAQSHMMVMSPDGKRLYTANVGPGTISVLDLVGRRLVTTVKVGGTIQRISISADGRRVYTSDQDAARVDVLETATDTRGAPIALPEIGYGSRATADGRYLLVTLRAAGKVAVLDAKTGKVVKVIETGAAPIEVLLRPDGKVAYVSCGEYVGEIDLGTLTLTRRITAGGNADGMAWAGRI